MRRLAVVFSLLFSLLLSLAGGARAQAQKLSVDIVNGTKSAIPVAVVPFAKENTGVPPTTKLADIIRMDLARSGVFRSLDRQDIVEFPTRGSEIKFATWRLLRQDYIVVGHIADAAGGGYAVSYELWNVNKRQLLRSHDFTAQKGALRRTAHQIADQIYQTITGVRGAFDTRIAYVTALGSGRKRVYSLIVADADGFNSQVVLRSHQPLLSPAWSPHGAKLAYVSFESGNSAIYIQDLASGARQLVSAHKGINGAPAFSADGARLAVSLSYAGNPEIYTIDLATHKETRLTHSFAIDTEPTWMPDGKSIVFTSDRSGKPQLYRMPASGGMPQRLTFQGQYNAHAAVSPQGKDIAMVRGNRNVYRIAVMDLNSGGHTHFVSPGDFDETPSFAPNTSMLLYAATEGSRGVLYSVSRDGKVRQRLVLPSGDVREPAWGPYR